MALLAAISLLVYLPALFNGFVLDDFFYISYNKILLHPLEWPRFFFDPGALSAEPTLSRIIYRPLVGLSHGLNRLLTGGAPFWFHLHDSILHAANTGLVFLVVTRLLGPGAHAWAAALIFCLHPVQAQSVAYAGSRSGLLSLFFVLIALLSYMDTVSRKKPWLSWTCFGLALLSRESSIFFLALLPAYDLVFRPMGERWPARMKRWLPYLSLGAALIVVRSAVLGGLSQRGPWGREWGIHFQLTAQAWFEYLRMVLWPTALREPYGFLLGGDSLLRAWAMAGVFLGLAGLCLYGLYRRRIWGFAGFWFFAALVPVLNLVPFTALAADRFLYPALAGLVLLSPLVVPKKPRFPVLIGMAGFFVLLALANVEQQLHWRSNFVLAHEARAAAPGEPHAALRLSTPYASWRMFERAEGLARVTLRDDSPPDVRRAGLKKLGQIRMQQGRWEEAKEFLESSLALHPRQKAFSICWRSAIELWVRT